MPKILLSGLRRLLIPSLVCLCFPLAALLLGSEPLELDRSLIQQLLLVPALIVFVWLAPIRKNPKGIIALFAATAALIGSSWNFSAEIANPRDVVVMARLLQDPHEAKTQMIRDGVNRWLEKEGIAPLQRSLKEVRSVQQAAKRFPLSRAVVWGHTGTVQVSFPRTDENRPLVTRMESRSGHRFPIRLHRWVPAVAVETKPAASTAFYLGYILSGEKTLQRGGPDAIPISQSQFRSAATLLTGWSARGHLGYAWWRNGNLYAEEALLNLQPTGAEAQCARWAYGRAAAEIRPFDHPQLRAAIFNNKAALLLGRSIEREKAKGLREAQQLLKKAFWMTRRPDHWKKNSGVKRSITRNLRSLKKWRSILSGDTPAKKPGKAKLKRKRGKR